MENLKLNPDLDLRVPARVNPPLRHQEELFASLDGIWAFRLDPHDEGVKLGWFDKPGIFKEEIQVPGCWQGQGFGSENKDEVWDFRIPARVFQATYRGIGWYSKSFQAPRQWRKKRIWLNFGGVHPSGEFWLNGEYLGNHSAPFVSLSFDVTRIVSFDNENLLVVRVSEKDRWLGLAYNWQGNWSGLYRSVELKATGECWMDRFWAVPDVDTEKLKFRVGIGSTREDSRSLGILVSVAPLPGDKIAEVEKKVQRPGEINFDIPISSLQLWGPEKPNLYRVEALLQREGKVLDAICERVGFIKLSTKGKHFLINDQPYYLRGTGEFFSNPESGSPDTSRERWRKKLSALKEYGYNYVRCQSYVPTPEYYDIADEVGLLIQGEMGMLGAWGGHSDWHTTSWPTPNSCYYQKLKCQWEHTVMRDINHPSANIYCMSSELCANTLFPQIAWQCYHNTKKIKPTAFLIWTDGGYNPNLPGDFVNYEADVDKETSLPLIQHEFRWWSSYPDVRIKDKYKGAIRPYAIEIAEEAAASNGMTHLLPHIAHNSQKLQYIEARTKLESLRRDYPQLAGISHFSAADLSFTPQGILNEFYEKKLVSGCRWRQTMGDTVILIDKGFDDRIVVAGETLECSFFTSDFSHPPLEKPLLKWELLGKKGIIQAGELAFQHQPFRTHPVGKIRINLPTASKPSPVTLRAQLSEGERVVKNQWSFWLFPKEVALPSSVAVYDTPEYTWLKGLKTLERVSIAELDESSLPRVLLSETLDESLLEYIYKGGRVLLAASEGFIKPFTPKYNQPRGRYFFLPPANYAPYEDGNSGTIISQHFMLGDFPHQGFADLQFYRMIAEAPPLDLRPLKMKEKPIIRAISTYYVSYPLAYLGEFAFGKGGLIISALNLDQKLPEAQYLLSEILKYTLSSNFKPKERISEGLLDFISSVSQITKK